MHNQQWEQLLERYYAGETSLDEERHIRQKLLEGDLHSPDRKLAAFFKNEQKVTLPMTTATRIRQRITGKTARQRQIRSWLAIAASVLLAISVWFMQPKLTSVVNGEPEVVTTDWSKYEVNDPEAAAAIILQSLHSVSDNFKAGKKAMQGITNAASLQEPLN